MKLRGLRWHVIGLVFLATVSNYIDRQTVNVLSPLLIRELDLTKFQFSQIAAAFLGAYTIGMTFSGRLFDHIGLRVGLAQCIAARSLVASAHALLAGFAGFLALRFLLGLAEAGNWPCASCSGSPKPATGPARPRSSRSGSLRRSAPSRWASSTTAPVSVRWSRHP